MLDDARPSTAADDRDLVLTRLLQAPRAAVWRCWTEPALLGQWFAPKPWTTPEVSLDLRPGGVTWLTGAPPGQPDMQTQALNDVNALQVIAGDSSGLHVILPWFASTSTPASERELQRQRDVIAGLPPFLPAPGSS